MSADYMEGMLKPLAALAVVFMAVYLSRFQNLNIEKDTRFAQLSIIGFILKFIFRQTNCIRILIAYLFMVFVPGHTVGQRAKHVPQGKYIAGISILSGTSVTLSLLLLLRVFPFTPCDVIPVAVMMVGNVTTSTGVTMKRLRDNVEMQKNQVKRALVIGLTPVHDSAKTVRLISFPGAMTSLIKGGVSPLEAIQLQIVAMNTTIEASTANCIMSTFLCWPNFFTYAYQLETKVFAEE